VTCLRLPEGLPPRQALFFSWASLTVLLSRLGWIDDPAEAWHEATARLRARSNEWGPNCPEPRNRAKRLARDLAGRLVFIYAGTERMAPVATRMRNQLNENAKLLGHSALAPELNHNEIVGWERLGPLRERLVLVILSDREDAPEIAIRLRLTAEYAERQGVTVHTLREEDGGRMARVASMVQFGDYVSFYLALVNGIDPTPIASIDEFKQRLAEWKSQHAR
jgi:glucose/mannose-6-phosphate isomerase